MGGTDDDLIDSFAINVSSDQPACIGATLLSGTSDGVLEGVYGYSMIGLTGRSYHIPPCIV